MNIFLSYASEQRDIAEQIELAIAGSGHRVFRDRSSLPPGGEYHTRIRSAVNDSDVFIFLVSPNSVTPGSYALTELKLAREKWPHPRDHVLPVMVERTDYQLIPSYLSAVTILEPEGNVAAEVAAELQNWDRDASSAEMAGAAGTIQASESQAGERGLRKWLAGGGVLVLVAAGLWYAWDQYQKRVEADALRQEAARVAGQDSEEVDQFRRIYYEGFSAPPDPAELQAKFEGIWLVGKKSDWEGRIENGVHTLCNVTGDTTASFTNRLRYYASESDNTPAPLGDSKVTVKVRTEPPHTTHSGAGLRFRSVEGKTDYYAFVLNPGNSVSLLHRAGNKLRILWSGEVSPSPQKAFRTLKIIGRETTLHLYVNNKLLHSAKKLDLLDGDPGIMAYSTGCFVFDDFAIYQRLD